MNWFNTSPPTLQQVLLQKNETELPPAPQILERIHLYFGPSIGKYITNTTLSDVVHHQHLYHETLAELTAALYQRVQQWKHWQAPQIEALLPEVVEFVRWKVSFVRYSKNTHTPAQFHRLAEEGVELLTGLKIWLVKYGKDSKPTRGKRLYGYVEHEPNAQNEILRRTLRCVIAKYQYDKTDRTLLALTPDLQLTLKPMYFETNLYEQLGLCVFLRFNDQEIHFITDTESKLYRYLWQKTWNRFKNPENVTQSLVQDTHSKVCEDLKVQIPHADVFFIDQRMSSYVIGFFRTHRSQLLWPYVKEKKGDMAFDEDWQEPNAGGFTADQKRLVWQCLKTLSLRCQVMIKIRYINDYYGKTPSYDTIAEQMMLTKDTVENAYPKCEENLKACVQARFKDKSKKGLRVILYSINSVFDKKAFFQ
ncbi:MAG: hypothetical protein ACK4GN_04085 [Runella sp.]